MPEDNATTVSVTYTNDAGGTEYAEVDRSKIMTYSDTYEMEKLEQRAFGLKWLVILTLFAFCVVLDCCGPGAGALWLLPVLAILFGSN